MSSATKFCHVGVWTTPDMKKEHPKGENGATALESNSEKLIL